MIVQRLSRLGRNTRDLHNIVAELNENGVALVSIKEKLDLGSPSGRVLFTMLSAIDEFELKMIHEQMLNWMVVVGTAGVDRQILMDVFFCG